MHDENRAANVSGNPHAAQSGAALLAFILVFIIGGSFFLLKDLNANVSRESYRNQKTFHALKLAKEALIGYAVRYPEQNDTVKGPGWLPCPADEIDQTDPNFGVARSNCATSTLTDTGLLPWKTLGVGYLTDSNGDSLWYALSDGYRNTQAASVKINSETPGEISVDDDDDVVAVVIAPGVAIDAYGQARPSISPSDYLEGENGTAGDNTFSYLPTADSNDIVVTITRRELMQAVETRVLGDVRNVLERYYDNYGKYPWLSRFANPRAGEEISGVADAGSNSTELVDSAMDFTKMGLQEGDLIVNEKDGSRARIVSVNNATSITVDQLYFGKDNDFDNNDTYVIPRFNGSVNTRQGLLPFHRVGENFSTSFGVDWQLLNNIKVKVDGITTSYHRTGIQNSVSSSYKTVSSDINVDESLGSCSWTVENAADCKGIYTDMNFLTGSVTASLAPSMIRGESIQKLVDCKKDFTDAGVQQGDLVLNYTDAGTAVQGAAGAGSNETVLVDTTKNFIAAGIEPRTFIISNDTDDTEGLVETVSATSVTVIALPGEELGFSEGDDYTIKEVRIGTVYSTSSAWINCPYEGAPGATNTLVDMLYVASANEAQPVSFDFNMATGTGDAYRILIATDVVSENADSGTSGAAFIVYDDDIADFAALGVRVGDAVTNTWYNGFGVITALGVSGSKAWFTYTRLQGGSYYDIYPWEGYRIYHTQVNKRQYTFELNFSGVSAVPAPSVDGSKRRSVCSGYGADCSAEAPVTSLINGDTSEPSVTISDYDINNNEVGRAEASLKKNSLGAVRVSDLHYDLVVNASAEFDQEKLPAWFADNNWHHLVYIASSAGDMPGAVSACIAGTDCLQVNRTGNDPVNSVQSLIIAAGEEIVDPTIPLIQDRSSGTLTDYFESDNNGANDIFRQDAFQSGYNDQVMILRPSALP